MPKLTTPTSIYNLEQRLDAMTQGTVLSVTDGTTSTGVQLSTEKLKFVDSIGINFTTNANDEVTATLINSGVSSSKIAANAVTTDKILDANVTAAKLAADSVTSGKIAANAVTTAKILDANVTAAKLAADSVTTAKILDANVTADKLAVDSVTSGKIAANAVTTAKILDANVTSGKLANDSVTTAKILDSNVTTSKLADSSVTTSKLADSSVTSAKLSLGGTAAVGSLVRVVSLAPTVIETAAVGAYVQVTSVSTGVNVGSSRQFSISTFDYTGTPLAVGGQQAFTVTATSAGLSSKILISVTDQTGNGLPYVRTSNRAAGQFDVILSNLHSTDSLTGSVTMTVLLLD